MTALDRPFRNPVGILILLVAVLTLMGTIRIAHGDEIKGLMEPIRSIELASEESGIIKDLKVTEGQRVFENELLAQLSDEVQQIQLELAAHLAQSKSSLEAASKAFDKRTLITERIRELRSSGNASESELIRSELELAIAKAKYLATQEELGGRKIELRRAELSLARRQIKAPFDGIVAKIHYQKGEYLTALRPELLQLVQVDELLAVFPVPVSLASSLQDRKTIPVKLANGKFVEGTIHSIGVTADAGSNTVNLKVKIANADGKLRSGEECYIQF